MDGFARWVCQGSAFFPSIDVSLSAFYFQDKKKKKVPSDLEKVSVLWVEREVCER